MTDPADDAGAGAKRMPAQCGERGVSLFGRRDHAELAFVGEVKRIEAED